MATLPPGPGGRVAGRMILKQYGYKPLSQASPTICFERRYNVPMRPPNAEVFAELVRDTSKPLPEGFESLKRLNLALAAGTAGVREG
jgi:hypothetical protein